MNCDACGRELDLVRWYGLDEDDRLCPDCYAAVRPGRPNR